MTHRHSLFANRRVLLGIVSTQGIDTVAQSAKRRLLGIIIPWQTETRMFRMFGNEILP
jgi:hypothetical protein